MHLPVNYSRRLPHQQQKFLMSIKAIVGVACLLAGMDAALGMFADTDGWAVSQALSAALGPYQKAAVFIDTSLAELHLPVRPDTPPAAAVIVVAGLGTPTRFVAERCSTALQRCLACSLSYVLPADQHALTLLMLTINHSPVPDAGNAV